VNRPVRALALAALVVLSGCTFGASFVDDRAPVGEELGWEGGYRYDDPLRVDTSDGLNASEREAVVARTMARVELIRGLEFEEAVPVEVISREAYRERRNGSAGSRDEAYGRWNDQVWEATFLVGEDTAVAEAFDSVLSASVIGFYSPRQDRIVVVSDAETPRLDRATLSHELVHALQDQQLSFGGGGGTQDLDLAEDGLVEGDANTVEAEYESRCGSEWDCVPRPEQSGGGGGSFDRGVFLTVFTPYAVGPDFVRTLRERSGGDWGAVNDAYQAFPESTEQVIHAGAYPEEEPVEVTVPDRSGEGYERFDLDRETDTVGEATVYAMFWANDVVPEDHPTFVYDQRLSAGWGGDTVVPYRGTDGEDAYVWRTAWDTERDAREFLEGYRDVLDGNGAVERGDGVYVIESGPYADAFRVVRRGNTVTVVNAPTIGDLDSVHAPR
jgi:hypothetical protein